MRLMFFHFFSGWYQCQRGGTAQNCSKDNRSPDACTHGFLLSLCYGGHQFLVGWTRVGCKRRWQRFGLRADDRLHRNFYIVSVRCCGTCFFFLWCWNKCRCFAARSQNWFVGQKIIDVDVVFVGGFQNIIAASAGNDITLFPALNGCDRCADFGGHGTDPPEALDNHGRVFQGIDVFLAHLHLYPH